MFQMPNTETSLLYKYEVILDPADLTTDCAKQNNQAVLLAAGR